jgi:hypothetical protein
LLRAGIGRGGVGNSLYQISFAQLSQDYDQLLLELLRPQASEAPLSP